jgi:hypothetical protein
MMCTFLKPPWCASIATQLYAPREIVMLLPHRTVALIWPAVPSDARADGLNGEMAEGSKMPVLLEKEWNLGSGGR